MVRIVSCVDITIDTWIIFATVTTTTTTWTVETVCNDRRRIIVIMMVKQIARSPTNCCRGVHWTNSKWKLVLERVRCPCNEFRLFNTPSAPPYSRSFNPVMSLHCLISADPHRNWKRKKSFFVLFCFWHCDSEIIWQHSEFFSYSPADPTI